MTEPTTDEAVARQVQRGQRELFGVLMERYEARLTRYTRKFMQDGRDAEDAVQEAFIKAYTNIQSFDASRRFSPWIYRIAHNVCINTIKKRGREPLSFFDTDLLLPHPIARETADGDLNRADTRATLDTHLGQISPKYREVLVLYYFEELSYEEIAEVLHIPASTVGVRLARAKAALKKQLPPTL